MNFRKVKQEKIRKIIINYVTKYVTKVAEKDTSSFKRLRWFNSRDMSKFVLKAKVVTKEYRYQVMTDELVDWENHFITDFGLLIAVFCGIPTLEYFSSYLSLNLSSFLGIVKKVNVL